MKNKAIEKGDIVLVVANSHGSSNKVGDIGVVVSGSDSSYQVSVKGRPSEHGEAPFMHYDELEVLVKAHNVHTFVEGDKVKAFQFESEKYHGIAFTPDMRRRVGRIGEVVKVGSINVVVRFEDGVDWSYPIELAMNHVMPKHVETSNCSNQDTVHDQLKVGDKVLGFKFEYPRSGGPYYNPDMDGYIGKVGTVEYFAAEGKKVRLTFEGGTQWTYPTAQAIKHKYTEPVETKDTLKVGDKIKGFIFEDKVHLYKDRIKLNFNSLMEKHAGEVGTIMSIKKHTVFVKFDDGDTWEYPITGAIKHKYTEPDTTEVTFKVGDTVEIIANTTASRNEVGDVGVITEVMIGGHSGAAKVRVPGRKNAGSWSMFKELKLVPPQQQVLNHYQDKVKQLILNTPVNDLPQVLDKVLSLATQRQCIKILSKFV